MHSFDSDLFQNRDPWEAKGFIVPSYDRDALIRRTGADPLWLHFGAGNIFRAFIARIQDDLLEKGLADRGIIVAETYDPEIIDAVYTPFDNLFISADLSPDGDVRFRIPGSVTESVPVDAERPGGLMRLREIAARPSLSIISLTVTEKGYTLWAGDGSPLPDVARDMAAGPGSVQHLIGILCTLLFERYEKGGRPIAVVSMDNMRHNGLILRDSVTAIARSWVESGLTDPGFLDYLTDESRVSFPWSMIDKITPRPSDEVFSLLTDFGIDGMAPVITGRGTYIAPFVNAEIPGYLVLEDSFPNGRPPLHAVGVYFGDRETVERAERMKVCSCLNPLHTALAVFGCLLGFTRISDEMKDPLLAGLVRRIGYSEGLPVVSDPGILRPEEFLREVIEERLPNPHIPDAPQRIATDTSQKIPIRFGETILAYVRSDTRNASDLIFIPLTIAAWIRYLLGIDDSGLPMERSADPRLPRLTELLRDIEFPRPESVGNRLRPILSDPSLFIIDLYECGLGEKIENMFSEMLHGPGAVRAVLEKYLKS
ncbi:MAG: mannitol dehydrogenase family protein [Clostridiaceae bacterium]|nr:mannitol dehydrogenase family protein [Clostridiaceae bacterium]